MATILVDYENVCMSNGLKGVEYLNEKDTLIIFYSQCCEKIRAEYIEAIEKSGCEFKIRKLVKTGKNALDFYIAAECGCVSQAGETQIAIISKDKGFSAVADFFRIKSELEDTMVVITGNIENGLMTLNASDDVIRRRILKEKAKPLDIAAEQARMEECKAFRCKVLEAFEGTEYEGKSAEILEFVERCKGSSAKVLYTGALHEFGRSEGRGIYGMLKRTAFRQ